MWFALGLLTGLILALGAVLGGFWASMPGRPVRRVTARLNASIAPKGGWIDPPESEEFMAEIEESLGVRPANEE